MNNGSSKTKLYEDIIAGLRREPAYLLVFAITLVIFTVGAINIEKNPWVAGLTIGGAIVLAGFSIYLVERRGRPAVYTDSHQERDSLSELQRERIAIRGVFDGIVDNKTDTYFVYSHTPVKEFFDYNWEKIEFPFTEEERRVTTIPDARGISMIHTLLHLGEKTSRLHVITSRDFTAEHWDNNLIMIGSTNSNPKSKDALRSFNSPFRFSDDIKTIVEPGSAQGQWPKPGEDEDKVDYGVVVKLKIATNSNAQIVYFVIAGIGPLGTLACCHYLYKNIVNIHERFKASPFAYLICVDRNLGYTSAKEEKSMEIGVFHKH